jgi:hypothetical protein
MTLSGRIRFSFAALGAALLALGLHACGRAASEEELQIDSNTNWLMRCDSDDQCSGALRCYCGQCSLPCSQTEECGLLSGAECSPSGNAACSGAPSGGLCVLGCQSDAECGTDFTCDAGECQPRPCQISVQSWDDLYQMVANDLGRLDADTAIYTRYLSTANHNDLASCGAALTAERQGASKLLNSLSNEPAITTPTEVDTAQTLYRIDLRDYGWDFAVNVGGVYYGDVWDLLTANNPFAVPFVGDEADDAVADSQTTTPVMFVNSFLATATLPDIYYAILGTPPTYEELSARNGITGAAPDMLAGLPSGSAGVDETIAAHWESQLRTGYVWEIAQTGRPAGSLLENPLSPPVGARQLIFSLPNGLPAFATFASDGNRTASSDTFLDVMENDFRARAPRSFWRQHYPRPAIPDEVHADVQNATAAYTPSVRAEVLRLFPGPQAVDALLEREYQSFTLPALEAAHVDARLPEPIVLGLANFDRDVGLAEAAGELMISPDELSDNLDILDPALGVLRGGRLDRDDFAQFFRQSVCVLGVVNNNTPDPADCP